MTTKLPKRLPRMALPLLAVLLGLGMVPASALAQISLDDFSDSPFLPRVAPGPPAKPVTINLGGNGLLEYGFVFTSSADFNIDYPGLGGFDLTAGGTATSMFIDYTFFNARHRVLIKVTDNTGAFNTYNTGFFTTSDFSAPGALEFPFFGIPCAGPAPFIPACVNDGGADLTQVESINVDFNQDIFGDQFRLDEFRTNGVPPAGITVTPAADIYWPLDVATVNIDLTNATDLLGVGAELAYDDTRLTYDDASLAAGAFLDDGSTITFEDDDDAGTLGFSVTRTSGTGASGSGTAATMTFSVIDEAPTGTANFSLSDLLAVDPAGTEITLTPTDGSFEVGGVWPGDTDNNCTAEAADLLPIGLNFSDTCPARPGGFDITWGAKAFSPCGGSSAAANFSDSFVDATGDGEIDQNDVLPIGVNFGETHAETTGCTPSALPKQIATISLALSPQSVGSVIEVEVSSAEAVDALLGASFELSVDASVLKVVSIRAGRLLDEGDLLELVHLDAAAGMGAAAFSRKYREQATSGSGELAVVTVEVVGEMNGPSVMAVSDVNYNTAGGLVAATARLSSDASIAGVAEAPVSFALTSNYPNPFNPETTLRFEVPASAHVKLAVYDVLGRQVRVLVDGIREAGVHEVLFEAAGLPSGTYLYRLETPQGSFVQMMQLVK